MAKKTKAQKKALRAEGREQVKEAVKKEVELQRKTAPKAKKFVESVVKKDVKGAIENGVEVAKNMPQHVKNTVEAVKGAFKAVANNPEWYMRGLSAANLVNINYGLNKRQSQAFLSSYSSANALNYSTNGAASAAGIRVALVVPDSNSKQGWNQGISRMFAKIRSANGTVMSYTPYQLEQYVITCRSIHAAYAMLKRAYSIMRAYNTYDSTTPASYMAAMGLDYVTFSENAADVRMFGANLGNFIANQCILKCDLFERTRWMFENGFADSNDAKATPYFFYTCALPYITNGAVQNATVASNTSTSTSTGLTWNLFQSAIVTMMNAFNTDSMYSEIAADILRAFGQDAIYVSEIWPENMPTPIGYSEEVLTQIQNATLTGLTSEPGTSTWTITNTDFCSVSPSAWNSGVLNTVLVTNTGATNITTVQDGYKQKWCDGVIVNMYKDNVSSADTFVATRLSVEMEVNYTTTQAQFRANKWATEIPLSIDVVHYALGSTDMYSLARANIRHIEDVDNDMGVISQLDYHPRVTIADIGVTGGTGSQSILARDLWDCNNYGKVDGDSLEAINIYAITSLLWVPDLVRVSKTELMNR